MIGSQTSLDLDVISAIFKHYGLAGPESKPFLLEGGWLNNSWKITVNNNAYVIKLLNPKSWFEINHNVANKIACSFSSSFNTVVALTVSGEAVFEFNSHSYMLFPYIEGQILSVDQITSRHIITMSHALALMHMSHIDVECESVYQNIAINLAAFKQRVLQLESKIPLLVRQILDFMDLFIKISEEYGRLKNLLFTDLVIGHGDLDRFNVLWDQQNRYYLIDWELAGLINWKLDLVRTAISWSQDDQFEINTLYFYDFLANYLSKTEKRFFGQAVNDGLIIFFTLGIHFINYWVGRMNQSLVNSVSFNSDKEKVKIILVRINKLYAQKDQLVAISDF